MSRSTGKRASQGRSPSAAKLALQGSPFAFRALPLARAFRALVHVLATRHAAIRIVEMLGGRRRGCRLPCYVFAVRSGLCTHARLITYLGSRPGGSARTARSVSAATMLPFCSWRRIASSSAIAASSSRPPSRRTTARSASACARSSRRSVRAARPVASRATRSASSPSPWRANSFARTRRQPMSSSATPGVALRSASCVSR
jgi:hypothetical protein